MVHAFHLWSFTRFHLALLLILYYVDILRISLYTRTVHRSKKGVIFAPLAESSSTPMRMSRCPLTPGSSLQKRRGRISPHCLGARRSYWKGRRRLESSTVMLVSTERHLMGLRQKVAAFSALLRYGVWFVYTGYSFYVHSNLWDVMYWPFWRTMFSLGF